MRLFKKSLFLLAGILFFSASAMAQVQQTPPAPLEPEDITDQELEIFSTISTELQAMQQDASVEAKAVVEEAGMTFPRFQEIAMKSQNPQMADSLDLTEDEQKIIQEIQPKLMQINTKMQQGIMQFIQKEDMTPQKFQQIARAVQQHPELQQRLQELDESEG